MLNSRCRPLGAVTLLLSLVLGCGDGRETHFEEGTIVTTHTQNVRTWLEGVSQSGQLDSGAMLMKDEVAQMKSEGVDNVDELSSDLDALLAAKGAAQVKAKAKSMLAKLPETPTVPASESNS